MNRLRVFSIGLALAVLAGCGEPKLSGASEQAMKESAEKVSSSLDPGKRAQFKEAMQIVAFSEMDIGAVMRGEKTPDSVAGQMYSVLDGKTADEVIAKADAIKAERAAKEKAQALEEIAELESRHANAEEAKAQLSKFEVTRSRFYLRKQKYIYEKEPIIEIAVRNGTEHPISRAYFKGTIASPGRTVPWLVDNFNYPIPGGLEPGETAEWTLAPNMFSEWGKVSAPSDAVFTVEVIKVEGADSKTLFDTSLMQEKDIERLSALKAKYQ